MAKKMCQYRKTTSVTSIDGGLLKCTICTKKWPKIGGDCPKGVNPATCEIIPKRKSKVVRVKAWAGFDPDGKFVYASYKPTKYGRNPCIIEYKEKP